MEDDLVSATLNSGYMFRMKLQRLRARHEHESAQKKELGNAIKTLEAVIEYLEENY